MLCGLILVVILFEKLEEEIAHWSEHHQSNKKGISGGLAGRTGKHGEGRREGTRVEKKDRRKAPHFIYYKY